MAREQAAFCRQCSQVAHLACCVPPLLSRPAKWSCPRHSDFDPLPRETHVLPQQTLLLDFIPRGQPARAPKRARVQAQEPQQQQEEEEEEEEDVEAEDHTALMELIQCAEGDAPPLAALPSLEQLKADPAVVHSLSPLVVQFLAWQRLVQLAKGDCD